jgi:hypothetical protein
MTLEAIACTNCGASDVQEVKPSTYCCNHCGTVFKHSEPTGTSSCSCGTFAIGRCVECERPVCGTHSAMWGGVRFCSADLDAHRSKSDKAHTDAQARVEAERARTWHEWEERAIAELARAHQVERLIRLVCLLGVERLKTAIRTSPQQAPDLGEAIRDMVPELWSGDLMRTPGWNHDEVHSWLLEEAITPPTTTNVRYLKKRPLLVDQWKRVPVAGWTFQAGSTNVAWGSDHSSLTALVDGRRGLVTDADGGCFPTDPAPGFNVWALLEMGRLAELPPLPRPPPHPS